MKPTDDSFLQGKKIIGVTHEFLTGFMAHLEEYLIQKKIADYLMIQHPLLPIIGESYSIFKLYKKGKLVKKRQSKVASSIDLLNYIKASLLTMWWIIKSGEQWDLYIGNNGLNTFAGLIVKKLGLVKKVVFYSVDFVPHRFKNNILNNFYHWIDKIAVIYSNEVWILSPRMTEGRKEYLRLDKKYDKKQILVPEGVWLERIEKKTFSEIQKHTAIFVGTLMQRTGAQMVIGSIPYVLKKIPDFKLIIVGKGSFRDNLEKQVTKMGLEKYVEFKGFIESHKDVENLVASCAVGMATYTNDGSELTFYADPGKTKLYLGAGIPVIMTNAFYNANDIANSGAGVIVKESEKEIAEAIIKIISSEKILKQYKKNAITFAREFNHEILFDKNLQRILSNQ